MDGKEIPEINSEDEKERIDVEAEGSFAELFEKSAQASYGRFSPGDRVTGKIVKVGADTIFVDLGGKSEGTANAAEFRDEEGNLTIREGEEVELRVASLRGGIHLSKAIKARGAEAVELLRDAFKNQIPVEGRVAAVNKGGFDVEVSGLRAFCPISQMELRYCEKPEEHVGARYPFRIMEIKERGKNIVLSRRVLLQEEQEKKLQETLAALRPDLELEGQVTKLTDFGAFVDIGGVEGMVHVSEVSRARIGHPSEVLQPGQTVKVKILKMEPDKKGRQKISLSIKALEPDPWEAGVPFQEGEVISGKVSRLADFGAFVEIAPGLDGLVHRSEISYEKVSHPSRVLNVGDPVQVRVLKIDEAGRKVSLSIKAAMVFGPNGEEEEEVRLEVGQVLKGIVEDQKPYGLFVRLPQLGMKTRGLLPLEELVESDRADMKKRFPPGKEVQVEIIAIEDGNKIRLSQKSIKEREDRGDFEKFLKKPGRGSSLGTLGELFQKLKK